MKIDIYFTLRKQKKLSLMNFFIIFFLFLLNFHSNYCSISSQNIKSPLLISPNFIISLYNKAYFNNIIKFDKNRYQVGKFASNKNGDLVLELYENNKTTSKRLFYGLTKYGRYLFSNKSSYTHEIIIESTSNLDRDIDINRKSNSVNLFVSIENEENDYLLSLNSYNSWIELSFMI